MSGTAASLGIGIIMSAIQVMSAAAVSADQLRGLNAFASTVPASPLRDLLDSLISSVEGGSDVVLFEADAEFTPNQVAGQLKMSRTHLYALLDSGELASHRVGRDRRIKGADIAAFERRREADRRELAERFAHADATRAGAIEELLQDV